MLLVIFDFLTWFGLTDLVLKPGSVLLRVVHQRLLALLLRRSGWSSDCACLMNDLMLCVSDERFNGITLGSRSLGWNVY